MSVSEKKKIANAKWDKENMLTLGCRVRKEQAEQFKQYAENKGTTSNALLKNYVLECIGESSASIQRETDTGKAIEL